MKRTSAIVLAAGTLASVLAGCGQSSTDSSDTARPSSSAPAAASSTATPSSAPAAAPGATADPSKTTCAEFKKLDNEAEKALIDQLLAQHPDSTFAGSPNVALGTAKLVCLSGSVAETPVAVAAGIVAKNN
ncbi:hypothetical protein [Nocardia brasiliensis]|uniref:Lipoprotein n=1 Tax=Nocardia brasiliensis (strain ATCC 700358 / HUJEG-1) TaxID=1133849 RepID=K0F817_NOCB7|nr:hypothetical protein [Nocardia brasiliensis]AFU05874.1 hypothetical protein O3I_039635 [Nocardia brasiliensis ATCC 700358]OCF90046.1 hypothetical protein AW168_12985 [Nocardia brasiliensis]